MTADFNHFPELAAALPGWMRDVSIKSAKDVVDKAVTNAPHDTGFLQSSIYYSAHGASTYGQGIQSPPGDASILPEEMPETDQDVIVGVAANYGPYVEYGTAHGPAQPYLIPAADAAESTFMSLATGTLEETLSKVK